MKDHTALTAAQSSETDAGVANPPLHICHLILRLGIGGLENGLIHLIHSMDPRIFRHTILCLEDAGPLAKTLDDRVANVVALELDRSRRQLGAYRAVYAALRKLKPDLVHTRNLPACDLPPIARFAGVRAVVHSEHGLDEAELSGEFRRYVWVRRIARLFVTHYITLGTSLKDWLVNQVHVPRADITATYNGVNTTKFHPSPPKMKEVKRQKLLPLDWPENTFVIGAVGRLSPIKNFDVLLKACAEIRNAMRSHPGRIRLLIVGDGPERDRLERLVDELRLREYVLITGLTDSVNDWLTCMNLFVLPSRREGVSNTLLEAQAAGLPVVASAVGSTPEIVIDGETAILVRPNDEIALANGIRLLLEDPARMNQMGLSARAYVSQRFSWAQMANDHANVYCSALGLRDGFI